MTSQPPGLDMLSQVSTQSAGQAMSVPAMFDAVYSRLKAMAGKRLGNGGDSLDTTALVHELYLRLSSNDGLQFDHPNQFFAYAARAMRHLLCDRARDRLRQRSGGDWARVTFTGIDDVLAVESAEQALTLEDAMQQLERADPRAAHVVELRYFAGMNIEQIAQSLDLNARTVDRDWRFARAFLNGVLG